MDSEAFNEVVQYTSCVVSLTIALEKKMRVRTDTLSPQDGDQYVPNSGGTNATEPLVLQPDSNTIIYSIVPKKCNVSFQGYRQAAKYDVTLEWKNLPLDPRVVRSITVEIHMGLIKPLDFAKGQSTRDSASADTPAGTLRETRSAILQVRNPDGSARRDTLVIRGIVDEWKTDFGNGYDVHLQGRDVSGVLMDSPITGADPTILERERARLQGVQSRTVTPPANTEAQRARRRRLTIFDVLDTRQTIGDLVRQILRMHPRMHDLRVITDPAEWPNGTIPSPLGSSRLRRRQGAGGGSGAANMTYWDLITRYCQLVGAVPRIVGTTLELRPANVLFGADSVTRLEQNAIRLVYGRDVDSMHITRKYAGNSKPKVIKCVSTSPSNGRGAGATIVAIWPPRNRREAAHEAAKNFDARGGTVDGEELIISVPGVRDRELLSQIARGHFEEIGRNEVRCHVEVARLTTQDGALADVLRLRPGRSVELMIDRSRFQTGNLITSTLAQSSGLTLQAASRQLAPYVGSEDLARAMVASHRGIILEQLRFFYCAEVKLTWTNDKGIKVECELQNYWWPRQDGPKATGDARGSNPARRNAARAAAGQGRTSSNGGLSSETSAQNASRSLSEGTAAPQPRINTSASAQDTVLRTGRLRGFLDQLSGGS